MVLGRTVAIIESTRGDDAHLASADVGFPVGLQALATTACSHSVDFATLDGHDRVAGNAGRSLGFEVFGVPLAITRTENGGAPAIDGDVVVAVDALGTIARSLHVDDASVDDDIGALDAMIGCIHVKIHTFLDQHIALAVDTIVIGGVDVERTCAADEELALAVERTLMILSGAIGQLVAARQHEIGSHLALNVDGSTLGAGDIGTIQVQHEVGLAINVQHTIAGSAADDIADAFILAVIGNDAVATDGNLHTILRLCHRVGHIDGYLLGEGLCADIVSSLRIEGCNGAGGFGSRLVDGYLIAQQFARACCSRALATGCSTATRETSLGARIVIIGVIVVRAIRRTSCQHYQECCERHHLHCCFLHNSFVVLF